MARMRPQSTGTETADAASGRGPSTRAEQGTREKVCRTVILNGLRPIMFDHYPGDNDTKLEPWQKLYFARDSKALVLPAANIMSFLSAQNTDSAPKRLLDSRKYKVFCFACASFVSIAPDLIPFFRDDQPVIFDRLDGEVDRLSGVYIDRRTARLEKGIPNPKVRPVLPLPWSLKLEIIIWPNKRLQEQQLLNIFTEGGIALGLGTNRPEYGKFEVVFWE